MFSLIKYVYYLAGSHLFKKKPKWKLNNWCQEVEWVTEESRNYEEMEDIEKLLKYLELHQQQGKEAKEQQWHQEKQAQQITLQRRHKLDQ